MELMIATFLRFKDLQARGVVANWPQLANLQKRHDFPEGRLLGVRFPRVSRIGSGRSYSI